MGHGEGSGVDSGIRTLVCPPETRCVSNMKHPALGLERQGPSTAGYPLSVYHGLLIMCGYCPIQVGKLRHREGKWLPRPHRADGISSSPKW